MKPPDPSTFIAEGASAQVYRLGGGRVIKLFRDGVDPVTVAREYAIAQAVGETGLPAPRAFALEQVGTRQGIVFADIGGPSLLAYLARHPHRWRWALREMAVLQQRIAACRLPQLRSRKATIRDDINHGPVDGALRQAAIERLEALEEGEGLTHGDLHPGNLIVMPGGLAVIDWPRAARGAAAADVVRSEMLMRFGPGRNQGRGQGVLRDLVGAYYVRRFSGLAGLERERLAAWRPLVALAWLRQRQASRDAAFAAYLGDALKLSGLPPPG